MEVVKAITTPSTGTVIQTANKILQDLVSPCRDIVAVPIRRPTNSDFFAECAQKVHDRSACQITRRSTAEML